jgi:hypothetical protein
MTGRKDSSEVDRQFLSRPFSQSMKMKAVPVIALDL